MCSATTSGEAVAGRNGKQVERESHVAADRRLWTRFVSVAALAVAIFGGPSAHGASSIKRLQPADGTTGSGEEIVSIQIPTDGVPRVSVQFTNAGATLRSARMLNERFTVPEQPELQGFPDEKRAAGQVELVSTWSPVYLPYQTIFRQLQGEVASTLVVRKVQGSLLSGGVLNLPPGVEPPSVDRVVRPGDRVRITAPEDVKGTYRVKRAGASGILLTDADAIAGKQAHGVAYEILREGTAAELWASDNRFVRVSEGARFPLVYVWPDPAVDDMGFFVERRFDQGENPYELDLTVTVHNLSEEPLRYQMGVQVTGWQHPDLMEGAMFMTPPELYAASCLTGEDLEREEYPSLHEEPVRSENPTQWVGVDTRYFLLAATTGQPEDHLCTLLAEPPPRGVLGGTLMGRSIRKIEPSAGEPCVPSWLGHRPGARTCKQAVLDLGAAPGTSPEDPRLARMYKEKLVAAGGDLEAQAPIKATYGTLIGRPRIAHRYTLFLGPKEPEALKKSGRGLDASLDFGILSILAKLMLSMMSTFKEWTGHWWAAIVLLTLIFKIALLPLTNKYFRSMARLGELRPKLEELKEKFGDDKEGFGRAQMELFKREGVNPLGGCFPMLLQAPIWFALYRSIYSSVDLYNAPLGLWIHDLSSPDPTYIFPIILGFLMLGQSYFTPTAAGMDPVQQRIMKYGMPAMFAVMMISFPSGLVLYISVNTVLTIVQNVFLRRDGKKAVAPAGA